MNILSEMNKYSRMRDTAKGFLGLDGEAYLDYGNADV